MLTGSHNTFADQYHHQVRPQVMREMFTRLARWTMPVYVGFGFVDYLHSVGDLPVALGLRLVVAAVILILAFRMEHIAARYVALITLFSVALAALGVISISLLGEAFRNLYFPAVLIVLFVSCMFIPFRAAQAALLCFMVLGCYVLLNTLFYGVSKMLVIHGTALLGSGLMIVFAVASQDRLRVSEYQARMLLARQNAEQAEQVRRLAGRLVDVQEQERLTIMRHIHDEFGGLITGLRLQGKSLEKRLATQPGELLDGMTRINHLAEQLATLTRNVLALLRPEVLDRQGLRAALESLLGQWSRSGVHFQLHIESSEHELLPGDRLAVFRIAQEAINNALKYADARHINVVWMSEQEQFCMQVIDDGVGFEQAHHADGFGIRGMHERAALLGGSLTLVSQPGRGTRITLIFPRSGRSPAPAQVTDEHGETMS